MLVGTPEVSSSPIPAGFPRGSSGTHSTCLFAELAALGESFRKGVMCSPVPAPCHLFQPLLL